MATIRGEQLDSNLKIINSLKVPTDKSLLLGDASLKHENIVHSAIYLSGQTGLDDLSTSGLYTLTGNAFFHIKIDSTGTPDTFEWQKDDGTWTTGVAMTGSAQLLQDGISITWNATTGHDINDEWEINVGHEIHISEAVHIQDDATIDGDLVVAGTIKSLCPVISLNESTGLIKGGVISINGSDNTLIDITAGSGQIVDSTTDPDNPDCDSITWTTKTGYNLTTTADPGDIVVIYIALDSGGNVVERPELITPEERRNTIDLGLVARSDTNQIVFAGSGPTNIIHNPSAQLQDLLEAWGAFNIDGNRIQPNAADLQIKKTEGSVFRNGINFQTNGKNPHVNLLAERAPVDPFNYKLGDGTDITLGASQIDPNNYDDGSSILATVPNNEWTIQYISMFAGGVVEILYGQEIFNSEEDAINAVSSLDFIIPADSKNAIPLAYLVLQQGDISLPIDRFYRISRGGAIGGATVSYWNKLGTNLSPATPGDDILLNGGETIQFALGTSVNEFSIDGTFSGDSDDAVPTEKAIKQYVDNVVGTYPTTLHYLFVEDQDNVSFGTSQIVPFGDPPSILTGGTFTSNQYTVGQDGRYEIFSILSLLNQSGQADDSFDIQIRKNTTTVIATQTVDPMAYAGDNEEAQISIMGIFDFVVGDVIDIYLSGINDTQLYTSRQLSIKQLPSSIGITIPGTVFSDMDNDTKIQVEKSEDEDIIRFDTAGVERFIVETDGTLSVQTANYETLVTSNNDIPNKKYVDDAVGVENLFNRSGTNLSPTIAGDDILLNTGETLSIADMTTGSIPFIGTSGLITQDNANLSWDATKEELYAQNLNTATQTELAAYPNFSSDPSWTIFSGSNTWTYDSGNDRMAPTGEAAGDTIADTGISLTNGKIYAVTLSWFKAVDTGYLQVYQGSAGTQKSDYINDGTYSRKWVFTATADENLFIRSTGNFHDDTTTNYISGLSVFEIDNLGDTISNKLALGGLDPEYYSQLDTYADTVLFFPSDKDILTVNDFEIRNINSGGIDFDETYARIILGAYGTSLAVGSNGYTTTSLRGDSDIDLRTYTAGGTITMNESSLDTDFVINGSSGEVYKHDAGTDTHIFTGDVEMPNLINDQASSNYFDIGTMRIQWGIITYSNDAPTAMNLPASFGNTTYSVVLSVHVWDYNADKGPADVANPVSVTAKSITQFTVNRDNDLAGDTTFDWVAIGLKP